MKAATRTRMDPSFGLLGVKRSKPCEVPDDAGPPPGGQLAGVVNVGATINSKYSVICACWPAWYY